MNSLSQKIEALLFWRAEPVTIKKLSDWLGVSVDEITVSVQELEQSLQGRGIVLMRKEDSVMLGTAPALSPIIEKITKEELHREIGKAGIETLSLITYFGPISRSEIDYIRGVNSTFVIRTLLMRGLVERVQSKSDQRSFLYKPTFDLLSHLGIENLEKLPEYESARAELEAFKKAQEERDREEVKTEQTS